MTFTAYITDRTGITRRFALLAMDRADALREAQELGLSLFRVFNFCVRGQ
jgi:hypothetical protein